jgi:hypothetical protein
MRKALLAGITLLLAAILLLLFFLPGGSPLPGSGPDREEIRYWKAEGLDQSEAEWLAKRGPSRREVPATVAAAEEVPGELPPEQSINLLLSFTEQEELGKALSAEGEESSNNIVGLCQENNCRRGAVPANLTRSETSVFRETGSGVVTVSWVCRDKKVLQPLFSEVYISKGQWQPRYLLQSLSEAVIFLTDLGQEALREIKAETLAACRLQ